MCLIAMVFLAQKLFRVKLSCREQRVLGEGRRYQLVDQHGEEHHIADHSAIGETCRGDSHSQGHTCLRKEGDAQIFLDIFLTAGQGTAAVGSQNLDRKSVV